MVIVVHVYTLDPSVAHNEHIRSVGSGNPRETGIDSKQPGRKKRIHMKHLTSGIPPSPCRIGVDQWEMTSHANHVCKRVLLPARGDNRRRAGISKAGLQREKNSSMVSIRVRVSETVWWTSTVVKFTPAVVFFRTFCKA